MAFLDKSEGLRWKRDQVVAALILSTLVGCALFELSNGEDEFGFNHRLHVEDEGLDCSDCHMGVEDSDDPGLPVLGQCMLCHEDLEEEMPPERQIANLFEGDLYKARHVSLLLDDVAFSHQQHVAAEVECGSCHVGIEESERISSLEPVTMADCMDCHAGQNVANDCSTCHEAIDTEWAPESHAHSWMKFHGQAVRKDSGAPADDCSLCHGESTCNQCHFEQPPEGHTNFFRLRGHAVLARLDRRSCATCHRTDICSRCHEQVLPQNHTGMFGGVRSTHCYGCHEPLASTGCFTCHKDTPSHLTATPLPPSHNPALDCRQCHPGQSPLPHADKGDACTLCHM